MEFQRRKLQSAEWAAGWSSRRALRGEVEGCWGLGWRRLPKTVEDCVGCLGLPGGLQGCQGLPKAVESVRG